MRNHRNAVTVLQGSRNGHRARTPAYGQAFQQPVVHLLIDKLAVVGGDVDVLRSEVFQLVDGVEQCFRPVAFERWQHLKGEVSLAFALM